jgi:formiminoglutamase
VPGELVDRIRISSNDILVDSDAFEREVYDLGDRVASVVSTDFGRAFVDVNRAYDDLPPDNPDGVIKTHTCYRRPIYKTGLAPDRTLVDVLLDKYYRPYHAQIQRALAEGRPRIQLGLDCHTMSEIGPDVAPDPGQSRPKLCLGNAHGKACSQEMIDRLVACFVQAFGFDPSDVTQNRPFAGAFITRHYGGNPIPWIQIEMNQSLYLMPQRHESELLRPDPARVRAVRQKLERTLRIFFDVG